MSEVEVAPFDTLRELDLDPYNPRLRKEEEGSSQPELIEIMLRRFRIEELGESILASGWLDYDPLLAVREDGHLRVLEGNRRLTAAKLLLDPSLAPPRYHSKWQRFAADLPPEFREQLKRLRVRVYDNRDHHLVTSYIGFRHVAGVLPWPAQEKASYIARLASAGHSYGDISEKLGSYPGHMRRHHVAFQIVEQAEEWDTPGARQMGDAFGVLLRSLQTDGIPAFIGIEPSDEPRENNRPIPAERKEPFEHFVRWTFGTEDADKVLPESRMLTKWGTILSSKAAVRYLSTASAPRFERAWSLSGGEADALSDMLWQASYLLEDSVALVPEHLDEETIRDAIGQCARFMHQIEAAAQLQRERHSL